MPRGRRSGTIGAPPQSSPRSSPMHHSIRRLALGAVVTGALVAGVPAVASASSTCSYNPDNKQLSIQDLSGAQTLRLTRLGDQIRYADGNSAPQFCAVPAQFAAATVNNTEKVTIFRTGQNISGGVEIDESQGQFAPGVTKEA